MTVFAGEQWRIQERGPAAPLTSGSGRQPFPPPLPLSEGLVKFLFSVSNSRRIRQKVAKSIVSLKVVGVSHVWFRKKGKVERYSLTLTLFLPAFCPLLTISLLSEEPLGNGWSRPSGKGGGRHPDSEIRGAVSKTQKIIFSAPRASF